MPEGGTVQEETVMRTLGEIMRLARAEDFTKANAEAIVKEQVDEMAAILHYDPAEAKKMLLSNLGYYCGYYPAELADKVYEMFDTEHPVFGRTHPTPEEAFRKGMEMAQKHKTLDDIYLGLH
jgi:hypothetical protein